MLRLATVTGALDWDDTDAVVHPANASLVIGTEGIEQGRLLNLETFINGAGGVIALTETDDHDPVAGDLLEISGEFQSDGGELWLDVVLDDGAVPMADILLLETVSMPNGNPTLVSITNAGGDGEETTGDGILIIDADTDQTGGGAFVLADAVTVSGAYQYTYTLNYDPADFAWYLQTTQEAYIGTAEYPALVAGAVLAWHVDMPQLHNRLHGLRWTPYDQSQEIEPAAWTGSPSGPPTVAPHYRRQAAGGHRYILRSASAQARRRP